MRPTNLPFVTRPPLAFLTFFWLVALPPAAVADDTSGAAATKPRLHQAFKACGKKWMKKAERLNQDQLRWMLAGSHRIYHLEVRGERIASLEILSTASFRDCDLLERWNKRETTVRVTLFLLDGSTRVRMSNYAIDETFFNGEPAFYPQIGRILLRGVGVDGRESNRWLEVEAMRSIYAYHTATRTAPAFEPAPAPVLTASAN